MKQNLRPDWEFVSDSVMGGVSDGTMTSETSQDGTATRLHGTVSTDNNGGFLQMAFDIIPSGRAYDARQWAGIEMDLRGNAEPYETRLRTSDLDRPWQSFRFEFVAREDWATVQMPFSAFTAHKHDKAFDLAQLRRVGVLAIGREFHADIAVAQVRFYS